ncbi:adenosylcobinamide-GDP ribazoletransferase [Lysobacter sp. LF1]|uniref:Adenosylcobinamide-GDP ribazoletransferase n=1 Tax=Lysobacter stagni TaxID=3045172 RepID=A0ABT6XIH6_9GAMM|nr:adenosylcobinamide-GDP ribazoletransferase [Lysobacter sp. LF1]MDI9239962.1 adenosylcobinamide-GDP ribazoletransferase [Lysobacter sp. LF1]
MIDGFLVALGFLTRIPVPSRVFADPAGRARSLAWYPMVGALIGMLLFAMAWLLPQGRPLLSAAVLLCAWVFLTGALHLDGLADSADAWVGGMGDRARTLEIMKDPRSGPAGVTVVVLVLLLKFAAMASLSQWSLLWLAPLVARMSLTMAFLCTPYVRSGGMGSGLADAPRAACAAMLCAGAACCVLTGWFGVIALACSGIVFVLWRRACMRRLGGITGDTAGALTEINEAVVLIAISLMS